ncbi:MAG: hypothetical protein ACE5KT_11805 [Methanosarcinales archaeon]
MVENVLDLDIVKVVKDGEVVVPGEMLESAGFTEEDELEVILVKKISFWIWFYGNRVITGI